MKLKATFKSRATLPMAAAAALLMSSLLSALPAQAQTGVTLVISPATVTAARGASGVFFSGTITNNSGEPVSFGGIGVFMLTAPAGGDPNDITTDSLAPTYPLSLGITQGVDTSYTGDLFSVDVSPTATLGTYSGIFQVTFTGDASGTTYTAPDPASNTPNFNVNVTAAPEPSGLSAALGFAALGLLAVRRARRA